MLTGYAWKAYMHDHDMPCPEPRVRYNIHSGTAYNPNTGEIVCADRKFTCKSDADPKLAFVAWLAKKGKYNEDLEILVISPR